MIDDIGYRIKVIVPSSIWDQTARTRIVVPEHWFGNSSSFGGYMGVYNSVKDAVKSAGSNGVKKGEYEIWKIHMGFNDRETPYFLPEKVYG